MNYKNQKLLTRMYYYLCDLYEKKYDIDHEEPTVIHHTIMHCFKRKDGAYRIELILNNMSNLDYYIKGFEHSYKLANGYKNYEELPRIEKRVISFTVNTIVNAPWISTVIKQFKDNAKEVMTYYESQEVKK